MKDDREISLQKSNYKLPIINSSKQLIYQKEKKIYRYIISQRGASERNYFFKVKIKSNRYAVAIDKFHK